MTIYQFKKQKAFTLAEILITLMVIGVISALVIPAVIQDTQDAEFKTLYKKAFAMASLATKQGVFDSLFMARSTVYEAAPSLYNFNVFKNQFSIAKQCYNDNNNECWNYDGEKACTDACGGAGGGYPNLSYYAFIDNSGMAWSMYSTTEDIILVDTNGDKAPNRYGKDRWTFVYKDQQNVRITSGLPYKIAPLTAYDIYAVSTLNCHYPPCYYKKWLTD